MNPSSMHFHILEILNFHFHFSGKMGLDSKELNIDLNTCFSSRNSFSDVLTEVSMIDDVPKKLSALNDYVFFLEQELRKVAVFRRELPLSVTLLNDAILRLKEEAMQLQSKTMEVNSDEDMDKKNWLSSVQLWTDVTDPVQCEKSSDVVAEGNHLTIKKGGVKREVMEDFTVADGLSLSIPAADRSVGEDDGSSQQQQSKKQRRCWSQELHQSFVNALFQLGGSQAATPKQIREIMQVDGLTNDEVKSHLQKYRLYIRKMQPRSAGAFPSGSPEGPLHMAGGEEEDAKSDSRNWKGRFCKTSY